MKRALRAPPVVAALLTLLSSAPATAHVAGTPGADLPSVLLDVGVPLLAGGLWYACGVLRLWAHSGVGQGIRRIEAWSFAAGWLALAVALLPPVDSLGLELFWVHMVQHEVLMLLAAPLLVLGKPLPALLWAFAPATRARIGRFTRAGWLQAAWHGLTRPPVAWMLHAAALWIWHVPVFFDAALTRPVVHGAQHLSFVLTALLFWSALLHASARESYGTGALYLFTTMVHTSVLGALITFASRPWYTGYLATAPDWNLSALEDQQLGGLIMWVPGSLVYLGAALLLLARWITASERLGRAVGRRD